MPIGARTDGGQGDGATRLVVSALGVRSVGRRSNE